MSQPLRVMIAFGTRPEAVKMAPLVRAFEADQRFAPACLVTAQHREMCDQVLDAFGLTPEFDLDLMRHGQTLPDLTARVLTASSEVLERERPDVVLVQGDTTTVLAVALAAFYLQIPVGHVEAGLRTSERYDPFPEEMNRRLTGRIASMHFAATGWARDNLLREGIDDSLIYVTGNTVIDALRQVAGQELPAPPELAGEDWTGRRLVLVTAHRRENLGRPLENICEALRAVAGRDDVVVVYAMHRNPAVREVAERILGGEPRVRLIEPPDYFAFVGLMKQATLILTDSGGIQEEAPALGVPTLVLRRTTERPEGVDAGTARLVGTETADILAAASELLDRPAAWEAMARAANPYGDGRAAGRIVAATAHAFGLGERPAAFTPAAGSEVP